MKNTNINSINILLVVLLCAFNPSEASIRGTGSPSEALTDQSMPTDTPPQGTKKVTFDARNMPHMTQHRPLVIDQARGDVNQVYHTQQQQQQQQLQQRYYPQPQPVQNQHQRGFQTISDPKNSYGLTLEEQGLFKDLLLHEPSKPHMPASPINSTSSSTDEMQESDAENDYEIVDGNEEEDNEDHDTGAEEDNTSDDDDEMMEEDHDIAHHQEVLNYQEMFGNLYQDGDYNLPDEPGYVHNEEQELSIWNALLAGDLDSARRNADGLMITPRSRMCYKGLSLLLANFRDNWWERLSLLHELYPSLFLYRCADGVNENAFVEANQRVINYILSYYSDPMIHDRIIEAAIMTDKWVMPADYFKFSDPDIVKRNIIVASNASNGEANDVLRRAYQEPPMFTDIFYADGETIVTRAIKLEREADVNYLTQFPTNLTLAQCQTPNSLGESPADLYDLHFHHNDEDEL